MSLISSAALAPFSVLYGAVTRTRHALYQSGLLPVHNVGAPVISVGNITAGGTGKTPLVAWLARAAAAEGRRVCVLSRGYKRADPGRRVLVSDGKQLLAGAREGGDEPRLLAENLLGAAAIVSDADRVAAAVWARQHLGSDLFILDDGFQHFRIQRDLNIVVLDATDPWGGGRFLPRGRLRESPSGLRRADCIVMTRAELTADLAKLRDSVRRQSGNRPVLTAHTRTSRLRPLCPTPPPPDVIEHAKPTGPFAAFCALGNPQAFFAHSRQDQFPLALTRAFPDHHAYTQHDIDALAAEAARNGAQALLTTAKDAVKLGKLNFALPCFVLEIELTFDDEATIRGLLRAALAS